MFRQIEYQDWERLAFSLVFGLCTGRPPAEGFRVPTWEMSDTLFQTLTCMTSPQQKPDHLILLIGRGNKQTLAQFDYECTINEQTHEPESLGRLVRADYLLNLHAGDYVAYEWTGSHWRQTKSYHLHCVA